MDKQAVVFFCCRKCQGLLPTEGKLMSHISVCSGSIDTSSCELFAVHKNFLVFGLDAASKVGQMERLKKDLQDCLTSVQSYGNFREQFGSVTKQYQNEKSNVLADYSTKNTRASNVFIKSECDIQTLPKPTLIEINEDNEANNPGAVIKTLKTNPVKIECLSNSAAAVQYINTSTSAPRDNHDEGDARHVGMQVEDRKADVYLAIGHQESLSPSYRLRPRSKTLSWKTINSRGFGDVSGQSESLVVSHNTGDDSDGEEMQVEYNTDIPNSPRNNEMPSVADDSCKKVDRRNRTRASGMHLENDTDETVSSMLLKRRAITVEQCNKRDDNAIKNLTVSAEESDKHIDVKPDIHKAEVTEAEIRFQEFVVQDEFDGKLYVCRCFRKFRDATSLQRHFNICQQPEIKCDQCFYRTKDVDKYARHVKKHATLSQNYVKMGDQWKCLKCDFLAKNGKNLTRHIKRHTKPYLCDVCPQRFAEGRNLQMHLLSHKGEFRFKCPDCDYKTRFKKGLDDHKRKHTGERFSCDVEGCSYRTVYSQALAAHKQSVHEAPTKYICSDCGYRTNCKGSFDVHMKLKKGLKQYSCSVCGYRGLSRSDVRRHMRSHTKEKVYFCDKCDFSTGQCNGMRVHTMQHLGLKPWKCSICNYSAITKQKVTRHMKMRHKLENAIPLFEEIKLGFTMARYRRKEPDILPVLKVTPDNAPIENGDVAEEVTVMDDSKECQTYTLPAVIVKDTPIYLPELSVNSESTFIQINAEKKALVIDKVGR